MLPNFIHIGVPKSGSATICDLLRLHPNVYAPRPKELNFFNISSNFNKGLAWYRDTYFSDVKNELIVCDNSIGYSAGDVSRTVSRIRDSLGSELKVLITLRHPVERAYSQYCMARFKGRFEKLDFLAAAESGINAGSEHGGSNFIEMDSGLHYANEQAMALFRHSLYIVPGRYADLVKHCHSAFGATNTLVLFTDDMATDLPKAFLNLTSFLGLDPIDVPSDHRSNEATSLYIPWVKDIYNYIYSFSIVRRIYGSLRADQRKSLRKRLLTWNHRKRKDTLSANPKAQALLQSYYMDQMQELSSIIGRDLTDWTSKYDSLT